MDEKEALHILSEFQKYRTSKPPYHKDYPPKLFEYSGRKLTEAIDTAIQVLTLKTEGCWNFKKTTTKTKGR